MDEITVGIIGCVLLLGLFLTGIELAFAMAIIGVAGYAIVVGPGPAMNILANDFYDALESYSLTVVPLFVLMGQIAFNAGIAKRLYDSAHKFLGHIPGGLAMATVAGATVFKAICGSIVATCATFASVAVPEMDRFNYSKKLSTGIVATVGTLGVLIPPSVTLILLGIITQQSIGKLFMAGVIPGLMLSASFAIVIFGWARINPQIGPACERFTWKARASSLPSVIWPIVIFLVIIGGLMKGFFTPTEAGSIGTFAVLVLCVLKRDINFAGIKLSVLEALRTSCMVLLIVASSNVLGHFVAVTNIPDIVAQWVVGLPFNRHLIMAIIFVIYLVGGSFIDDLAFMILATPIFFPAITQMGYDPIWACIMVSLTVCVGSVIPPVAMCVFVVRNITKVPMNMIYGGVYPFLISLIICIVLLFIFPQLILYLPSAVMK
ncbi:MAG: Sialic acid TRAP transporter permease protein SiaT [Syntrophorhabdaceae bacterium PtaU1.Bin034]|nr:MAG: Sialic acid TRAP transporter permease protein SiaT [Syntrophorhabdaceae bacterium PtaU1.Bin034]